MDLTAHLEKMKSMTCAQKARYVLEFVLGEKPPFTRSRHWNRIYQYFFREMHYQRKLEHGRRYNAKRALKKFGRVQISNKRRQIPPGFDSQSEFRRYVAAGMRRICTQTRAITRREAFDAGMTLHVGSEHRGFYLHSMLKLGVH